MSSKNIHNRRCIVQKLDFENCIVTSIKTTTRRRKKLRARITREIEHFPDFPEKIQASENSLHASSVLTHKRDAQGEEPTSPVLLKKQCRDSSPVLLKRKKLNFPPNKTEFCSEKNNRNFEFRKNLSESSTVEETSSSPPGSPVFKTFKKNKLNNVSPNTSENIQNVLGKMSSLDVLKSQRSSSSGRQSSYLIEDFTQETSQSIRISSVDSANVKRNSSSNTSFEQDYGVISTIVQHSPRHLSNSFHIREKQENLKSVKKNYKKKKSLLARLHKLQQKQASEKLLWQHQNRKNSSGILKVSVINFWKEEFNYFLNCQSDLENTFLIVNSRWVPTIKKVKEGSVLQLHPPWQKLTVEDLRMTVLLNVICLEILDEVEKPIVQKKTFESIPTDRFETDKSLFIDSLFSFCKSGFLY